MSLSLLFLSVLTSAEPPLEEMAAELARLRAEVETLSENISDHKATTNAEIRALSAQKVSLEAEIQRETLRARQLAQTLKNVQEKIRLASATQAELQPAVEQAIEQVRAVVLAGLPFKQAERLEELDKLTRDLKNNVLTPSGAVARLWSRVEDEIRLTRENGLYQQLVALEGTEVLADVARVGMMMLYFKTPDNRYGYTYRDKDLWKYRLLPDAEQPQAKALFDALEQRVRVGFFELPNALSQEARP